MSVRWAIFWIIAFNVCVLLVMVADNAPSELAAYFAGGACAAGVYDNLKENEQEQ